MTRLFFSIGPVQSFVAQARRTRDLWSGSFLLSYLAGQAMRAVRENGGTIVVPNVEDDELLKQIEKKSTTSPRIGSLPNKFEASFINGDPTKAADAAKKAVMEAWQKIAEAVWEKYVDAYNAKGNGTHEIWNRQINNFWEINWVVSDDAGALDARKNWRTWYPAEEPGDHCTMMGDWQELSGFVRSRERKKQDDFWEKIMSKADKFDIREGERLCAIALIKRLFPRVSEQAVGWKIDANNWPSTVYMAAVPWLKRLIQNDDVDKKDIENFANKVKEYAPGAMRPGIADQVGFKEKDSIFLNLDGNFYFKNALKDCRASPLKNTPQNMSVGEKEAEEVGKQRQELLDLLQKIQEKSQPAPFYAIVKMDGDQLGKLKRKLKEGKPSEADKNISDALAEFTAQVSKIVKEHNGVTIYAGGDDVLAMLAIDKAIECAYALSKKYRELFKGVLGENDIEGTISAGLVFAHYRVPIRSVLEEATYLLDEVAKQENGRSSIAVSVLKNSGKYCQWTTTWDELWSEDEGMVKIESMVNKFKGKTYSSSFFYNLRDFLCLISKEPTWRPGSYIEVIDGLDTESVLVADYLRNREHNAQNKNRNRDAEKAVKELLDVSYKSYRVEKGDKFESRKEKKICADAALLIKFLSKPEKEGSE